MITIRKVKEEDAEAIVKLLKQLDEETKFTLFAPGERKTTVEKQREIIKNILTSDNRMIFVAVKDDQLIGCLGAFGGEYRKVKHRIYIVIGVLQTFAHQGIGTQLFTEMEKWARENKFHRLELTVMTNNQAGLALYKKMGFEIEGIKKHSVLVNGEFIDEYYMAKLI
jgi:RimJ/RimL family protein N-acetyltransferase